MNPDPARPAELMEEDYIDPMAPLAEEEEAPSIEGLTSVPRTNPTHRRLSAIAGAGNAYVFITMPPDGGQVGLDFWGVLPEELASVLHQVGDAVGVPA